MWDKGAIERERSLDACSTPFLTLMQPCKPLARPTAEGGEEWQLSGWGFAQ